MKTLAWVVVALALVVGSAQAGVVTTNTIAPVVDGEDIAMLDLTNSAGRGKFWAGEGFAAGQTFATGNYSGGYLLKAVTIRYHGTYDPDVQTTEFDPTKTYGVRVVTLAETAITELHDEVFVHSVASRTGDYLTFEWSEPFALSPDTVFGFDVRMTASTSGWQSGIPTVSYGSNHYAGGEYYICSQWTDGNRGDWTAVDLALAIPDAARDWIFHLDIELSRPPGMLILLR